MPFGVCRPRHAGQYTQSPADCRPITDPLTSSSRALHSSLSTRMVSADNLNLDCLELIFAHLTGSDLASVSLVSRSFLAGVVPFLYRVLVYHLGNAKRRPLVRVLK